MRTSLAILLLTSIFVAACASPTDGRNGSAIEQKSGKQDASSDEPTEPEPKPAPNAPREYKPDRQLVEEDMIAIYEHFIRVAADAERRKKLAEMRAESWAGAKFFAEGVRQEVFDREIVPLLAIPGGPDHKADPDRVAESGEIPVECCSYCSPPANRFLVNLKLRGTQRCVVMCPNARNWVLFDGSVPMFVSDKVDVQWLTWEDFSVDYDITAEDWADPAGKLFGKKAPFQFTYE